jgi:hypothetical protein
VGWPWAGHELGFPWAGQDYAGVTMGSAGNEIFWPWAGLVIICAGSGIRRQWAWQDMGRSNHSLGWPHCVFALGCAGMGWPCVRLGWADNGVVCGDHGL